MKKIIAILVVSLFAAGLFAAEMEEWNWEDYNTSFSVPSDFKITKSDATQFSAANKTIRLTIFPIKGKAPNEEQMIANLLKWVDSNKIKYSAENLDVITDLNGYLCAYVEGTKDKSNVFAGMMFNPLDTNVRLYVLITYNPSEMDTGLEILKSFTPQ